MMNSLNRKAAAASMVVSVSVEGITVKMSGDKRLLAVRIPPEILGEWRREKLGEVVALAVNRARGAAELEVGRAVFLSGAHEDGARLMLELAAEEPELTGVDDRCRSCPELVAGVRALLAERGWKVADLAEASGLAEQRLKDLLSGIYCPLAWVRRKGQPKDVMDLTAALAQSFDVSPEVLWRRGIASLLEFERKNRRRVRRMFNGFKRARRQRRIGSSEADGLKLGALASAGVMSEIGLELQIGTENLEQMKRGLPDWISLKEPRRRAGDYGALLAPDGGILRESISERSFQELWDLDYKAAREPASITAAELERARELSGIPTLQVAGTAVGPQPRI